MLSISMQTFDLAALHSRSSQGHPWSGKVVKDFKNAYISLIIVLRGLACEANV